LDGEIIKNVDKTQTVGKIPQPTWTCVSAVGGAAWEEKTHL